VARDIISRGLEESVEYARAQRVRHVLVVGSPRTGAGDLLALDLQDGGERTLSIEGVLAAPREYFGQLRGGQDA